MHRNYQQLNLRYTSAGDRSVSGFLPDTDCDTDKSLCQGADAASEMGMGVFRFVRPAGGRIIKDSRSASAECPCNRVD